MEEIKEQDKKEEIIEDKYEHWNTEAKEVYDKLTDEEKSKLILSESPI